MNLNFQLALPKELEEVFSHFQKVILHMQSSGLDQWDHVYPDLETLKEDIQKNDLYLARIKEQIAVVFVLNQEMDAEYEDGKWRLPKETAYALHRLCIDPQYQKQGLGKETMKAVMNLARSFGATSLRLDAFSKNQAAMKLYQSLGFWETGYAHWRKGTFILLEKDI